MKGGITHEPVTMSALRELLTEMFAVHEQHMLQSMETMMDAKINQLDHNLTELINDCMERIDERFNRLEREVAKLKKGMRVINTLQAAFKQ
jgi:predicted nuclease with TOPRIM domain